MTAPVRHSGSLASRAVVTAAAAGIFAGLCWADATGLLGAPPAWWLAPVAALLGWGSAAEAMRMAAARGVAGTGPIVPAATAAVPLAAVAVAAVPARSGPVADVGWAAVAVVTAVAVSLIVEVARYRPGGGGLARVAAGSLAVVAIGLPLAFMASLRLLWVADGEESRLASLLPLVSMVAVVKGADVAAYVVGSLLGRHRMAPLVSPGKTWEGAVAALVAAVVIAWLAIEWLGQSVRRPWGGWPVYGVAVGAAGMLGDLAESLVKRELAAKDSGRSLGGLGGFLDLVDAALFAAPVAWLLWVLGA